MYTLSESVMIAFSQRHSDFDMAKGCFKYNLNDTKLFYCYIQNIISKKAFLLRKTLEVVLVEHLVFYEGGTEMKAVSKTFKLQTLKLPQFPLGLPLQLDMLQGQIQGMFYGFGFMGQAAFGDFEGKTGA